MMSTPHTRIPVRQKRLGRRIKQFLLVACIVVIGYALLFFSNHVKDPDACLGCHVMQPQVKTWQVTAHNRFDCITCHKNVSVATFVFREFTGRYRLPVENKRFIQDQICLDCHSKERIVTPPGDLLIPHGLHMQKGIDCIDCHENVVHANVNDELIVKQGVAPEAITLEMAEKLATFGNRIEMDKCMQCHNGAKAPRECSTCHTDKEAPASHNRENWGTEHGREAFLDITSCNQCHEYNVAKKKAYDETADALVNVQREARTNGFCYNCHIQRPVTHTKVYSVDHPEKARKFSQGCLACHNREKEPKNAVAPPTTSVYCEQCHFILHPSDWERNHPDKVRADGDAQCYQCHAATSCAACHSQKR